MGSCSQEVHHTTLKPASTMMSAAVAAYVVLGLALAH